MNPIANRAPGEQNTCTWKSDTKCGSISLNATIVNMNDKLYECSEWSGKGVQKLVAEALWKRPEVNALCPERSFGTE